MFCEDESLIYRLVLRNSIKMTRSVFSVDGPVGDVIFVPNDTVSAQKRTNDMCAAIKGAHKISKKTKQGTKGNTSELLRRRSYAGVTEARA